MSLVEKCWMVTSKISVIPVGVSRRSWAVACVCIDASPNKSLFSFTYTV